MLLRKALQLVLVWVALVCPRAYAATTAMQLCGRELSDMMRRVCKVYNSPSWDVPTVVEQPASLVRRRRQIEGIADQCCTPYGCTWDQLTEYCSITSNSDSLLSGMEAHLIADRSAEKEAGSAAADGRGRQEAGREVGAKGRRGGYGRRRPRRCRCGRARRSGRRRPSTIGNMNFIKNAVRAAPVVGTVSPLLTWGRTLNTDIPRVDQERYAYVAISTA